MLGHRIDKEWSCVLAMWGIETCGAMRGRKPWEKSRSNREEARRCGTPDRGRRDREDQHAFSREDQAAEGVPVSRSGSTLKAAQRSLLGGSDMQQRSLAGSSSILVRERTTGLPLPPL